MPRAHPRLPGGDRLLAGDARGRADRALDRAVPGGCAGSRHRSAAALDPAACARPALGGLGGGDDRLVGLALGERRGGAATGGIRRDRLFGAPQHPGAAARLRFRHQPVRLCGGGGNAGSHRPARCRGPALGAVCEQELFGGSRRRGGRDRADGQGGLAGARLDPARRAFGPGVAPGAWPLGCLGPGRADCDPAQGLAPGARLRGRARRLVDLVAALRHPCPTARYLAGINAGVLVARPGARRLERGISAVPKGRQSDDLCVHGDARPRPQRPGRNSYHHRVPGCPVGRGLPDGLAAMPGAGGQ